MREKKMHSGERLDVIDATIRIHHADGTIATVEYRPIGIDWLVGISASISKDGGETWQPITL